MNVKGKKREKKEGGLRSLVDREGCRRTTRHGCRSISVLILLNAKVDVPVVCHVVVRWLEDHFCNTAWVAAARLDLELDPLQVAHTVSVKAVWYCEQLVRVAGAAHSVGPFVWARCCAA